MKATIEVPDDLYRQFEAKSALEGRALEDVAIDLIRRYVGWSKPAPKAERTVREKAAELFKGQEIPPWFGAFEEHARRVEDHDMDAIRRSIARGICADPAGDREEGCPRAHR